MHEERNLMGFLNIISKSATKGCLLETQGYESDLCVKYLISGYVKKSQRHLWQMGGILTINWGKSLFLLLLSFLFFLKEICFCGRSKMKS